MFPLAPMAGPAQAGKLKLIVVTSDDHAPLARQVRRRAKRVPIRSINAVDCLFGPKDMPPSSRERIAADVRDVLGQSEVKGRIAALGLCAARHADGRVAAFLARERARWTRWRRPTAPGRRNERVERPPAQVLVGPLAGPRLAQAISVAAAGLADLLDAVPVRLPSGGEHGYVPTPCVACCAPWLALAFSRRRRAAGPADAACRAAPTDGTDSTSAYAVMAGERWVWQALGAMEHSAHRRAGVRPCVRDAVVDYYVKHPSLVASALKDSAASAAARMRQSLLPDDFSRATTVVDLAGGQGGLRRRPPCGDRGAGHVVRSSACHGRRASAVRAGRRGDAGAPGDRRLLQSVPVGGEVDRGARCGTIGMTTRTSHPAGLLQRHDGQRPPADRRDAGRTGQYAMPCQGARSSDAGRHGRKGTHRAGVSRAAGRHGLCLERTLATASTMSIIEAKPVRPAALHAPWTEPSRPGERCLLDT